MQHLEIMDSKLGPNVKQANIKIILPLQVKDINGVIDHVFLPRRLPQSQPPTIIEQEAEILRCLATTLAIFNYGFPNVIPKTTVRLFNMWLQLQGGPHLDGGDICTAIKSMEVGEMIALYIRQQNCGMIISMPKDSEENEVIFSTFPASLSNSTVTLSDQDIAVEFPAQSLKIPFNHILPSVAFAEQLSMLHNYDLEVAMPKLHKKGHTLPDYRDVPDSIFISEWLTSTLAGQNSFLCSSDDEFPRVVKKVKDVVLLEGGTRFPFRRSPFWMTMKVALQVNLERELGKTDGRFLYKLILIQLLGGICQNYLQAGITSIDIDLGIQMLAKLARRLEKVKALAKNIKDSNLADIHQDILNLAVKIIHDLRSKMNTKFESICLNDNIQSQLQPLENLDFENDIYHKIPNVQQYIDSREKAKCTLNTNTQYSFPYTNQFQRRDANSKLMPSLGHNLNVPEFGVGFALTDAEDFILENLDTSFSSTSIRTFAFEYLPKALVYYKDDPVGGSRMILTFLQMVKILDSIAKEKHPLLNDHHSGINTKIIGQLILPKRSDLKKGFDLEQYFDGRNTKSTLPSLIGEDQVTRSSFSARFPNNNDEMRGLRDEIIKRTEKEIEEKLVEVNKLREKVAEWREELYGLKCEYRWTFSHYYCENSQSKDKFLPCLDNNCEKFVSKEHVTKCRKCVLENLIAGAIVKIYEKPLSDERHNQNGVVFELLIPVEIACLRDVLFTFAVEFCKSPNAHSEIRIIHNEDWIKHSQLPIAMPIGRQHQDRIYLGSSTKSFLRIHVNTAHVDSPDDSIIVRNGRNCTFYGECSILNANTYSSNYAITRSILEDNIKIFCTLTVERNSPYKDLQWALTGTDHSQNDILATQNKCPPSLSLSEWIEFGSLRSGHRLQMRNLYRIISAGKLSCKYESVVSLVLQALWEGGPNNFKKWFRESHQDFADPTFSHEMGQVLDNFLQTHRNNWKEPYYLLTTVMITNRMLELNSDENTSELLVNTLLECRNVAVEWISTIEEVMKATTGVGPRQKLRDSIVIAAISCALSFSLGCSVNTFPRILSTPEHATTWLLALVTLDNNIILGGTTLQEDKKRNYFRIIRNTGFHIQDELWRILLSDGYAQLNKFAGNQWAAGPVEDTKWQIHGTTFHKLAKDNSNIYRCIQVDLIHGKFLVDGNPVARLPQNFVLHPVFQRIFQKTIFEVQPYGQDSYCTLARYGGCKYVFQMVPHNQLIITEQRPNGDFYELIPHEYFKYDVIYPLFQNYSHFWSKKKQVIEFREQRGSSTENGESALNHCKFQYKLHLKSRKLTQKTTGKFVVDVLSNSFQKISTFLSRFEKAEYIKIVTDSNFKAVVELSRMRLHFNVNNCFRLESQEYEGLQVSLQHKINGCFIGLQNGLLLEEINEEGEQKLFLVPHGEITVGNQKISISLAGNRKSLFFVYELNHQFRQIRAGKSTAAWFYLAYLHAITSHPLENPFSGITGTERALEILQSALCWSHEPYDAESIATLSNIAKLTPIRRYSNPGNFKQMENVSWPSLVPYTGAAHELYLSIVNKLIQDSQRLRVIFNSPAIPLIKSETTVQLNDKAYRRYKCYGPNANISTNFLTLGDLDCKIFVEDGKAREISFQSISELQNRSSRSYYCDPATIRNNMRIISAVEHGWGSGVSRQTINHLKDFLLYEPTLTGVSPRPCQLLRLDSWLQVNLKEKFLDLYNFARNVHSKNQHSEWFLFLSCMAFCGQNIELLLILQTVSRRPEVFANVSPPIFPSYVDPSHNTFNSSTVRQILESNRQGEQHFKSLRNCPNGNYRSQDYYKQYCSRLDRVLTTFYRQEVQTELTRFTTQIQSIWPCDNCNSLPLETELFNMTKAKMEINVYLKRWNDNRKLWLFFESVATHCNTLYNIAPPRPTPVPWLKSPCTKFEKQKFDADFEIKMEESFIANIETPVFLVAEELFKSGNVGCPFEVAKTIRAKDACANILLQRYKFFNKKSKKLWDKLITACSTPETAHLEDAGLYPRLVPIKMLNRLIPTNEKQNEGLGSLRTLIGAIGVLWTLEQQASRMIKYQRKLKQFENLLQRELDTVAHEGWSPMKMPEWLLFELESNLMIRGIQIKVAERMMKPPGEKHSVMQLNMGEGKTAVIVPLLCLSLADGNFLCRVTVLRSLFRTNLSALRFSIGGLLNRRIYSFPCRRDMPIGQSEICQMLSLYKECQQQRGVVMTLPEYMLSFQLKMYETAQKNDPVTASLFMETHKWLNANARDILDESDEILHAKYQLIYTVGSKAPVSGEHLRWSVAQDLLKAVPSKMKLLRKKFGVENIEFDDYFEMENGTERYTPCRILRDCIYQDLIQELVDDIISGQITMTKCQFPDLGSEKKRIVKEFLTMRTLDEETHNAALAIFADNPIQKDMILILAGYLKYEVLRVALSKRWRVNYGVNPKGHLRMAVPFKAKDVAAEMTEFGHPDVAICLTLLSYYYSGLSDSEILECFDRLERLPDADMEYEGWINKITKTEVLPSLRIYNGLPLEDKKKRDEFLFPVLRKNMYVIDFWLSHNVFPREARQFEKKMMTTAWDLVSEEKKNIVTGFSGTNDSKELLPGPICQNDLKELEETNENVRKVLLQEENESYHALPANVSGRGILEELVRKSIPILLDSGALMLELNNEQVAEEWLKMIPFTSVISKNSVCKLINIEAAVYFNDNNVLVVRDRQKLVTEFELSSYRDRLDRCIVYLDDSHTRGTDLKFPRNSRACVTLGGEITRDKTVQACMRMRMLGKGHSVSFWGSQEAHNAIVELTGRKNIKTQHVLKWIEQNSRNFEKDGLVHWATSGLNYAQKRAAHTLLANIDVSKLSVRCCNREILELAEMYGCVKNEELFTAIVDHQFDVLLQSFEEERKFKYENISDAKQIIAKTGEVILRRLYAIIPSVKRFAELMDEEQEKEMEQEKEQDVEVYRQVEPAIPCKSQLDKLIERSIRKGFGVLAAHLNTSVIELPLELRKYKFGSQLDTSWGLKVFATQDFISVVQNHSGYNEEFLRPTAWVVTFPSQNLLLLSPHEANAYIPIFRTENPVSTLHMYSPRIKPHQNSLINNSKLNLPIRNPFTIDGHLLAQLSLFSGTMYFQDDLEQQELSYFLGVVARPRSAKHQLDFDMGRITKSGFVIPGHRTSVSRQIMEKCKFKESPIQFLCGIVKARHGFFPSSSHVSRLVLDARKTDFEEKVPFSSCVAL